MTDLFADIALATEEVTVKAKVTTVAQPKWYRTKSNGWAPEPDDVTLAPRPLASCNANQCPSIAYAPTVEAEAGMIGAKLYYPMIGTLWGYRGTFLSHGGARYYEVISLNTIPGCGIRIGSVWSAQAEKFRRIP